MKIAAVAVAALILAGCGGNPETSGVSTVPTLSTPLPVDTGPTIFESTYSDCQLNLGGKAMFAKIGDDGHTLDLRGRMNASDRACVLEALDMPDGVMAHIKQTRAVDGMQEDAWLNIRARWTYDPDNGLHIILTLDAA